MFLLMYFGKSFGVSSNFRTICAIGGAGKFNDFFKFDFKKEAWNMTFLGGSVIGGFLAAHYLTPDDAVQISDATKEALMSYGIANPGSEFVPDEIFSWESLFTIKGFVMMVIGGFAIGFGSRYAGGCTSGHAISGLSNLQLPSLLAVIGFFIGGLFTTFIILPYLLQL